MHIALEMRVGRLGLDVRTCCYIFRVKPLLLFMHRFASAPDEVVVRAREYLTRKADACLNGVRVGMRSVFTRSGRVMKSEHLMLAHIIRYLARETHAALPTRAPS